MKHIAHSHPLPHQDFLAVNGLSLTEGSTGNWPDVCNVTPCSGARQFVCRGHILSHRLAAGCAILTPKREPPRRRVGALSRRRGILCKAIL